MIISDLGQNKSNDYCIRYDSLCFGKPTCQGLPNPYRDKVSRLFSSPAPPPSIAVAEDSIHVLLQYVNDQLDDACDTTCTAMAGIWIETLSQTCDSIANADQSRLDELRERFIAVCKNGCNLEHPFGSLTTSGDTTEYGDYSLQDAIEAVFPSLDSCDKSCSAKLLDYPGTYGMLQYTAPQQQIYYEDTCRCNRLESLDACWQAVSDTTTFLAYLNSLSNVQLTEAELLELQEGCDTSCTFMSGAITIPPILECGTCKTLAELKPEWDDFKSSGCIGGTVGSDEEALMAGHMNQLFGLNRSYLDYYYFLDTGLVDNPSCRYLCPLSLFPEAQIDTSCVSAELDEGMEALANLSYQNLLDSMRQVFVRNYLAKCLGNDLIETFNVTMPQGEYQYTLYYYDQADNLVRTVPPKGVVPLTNSTDLEDVKEHRINPGGTAAVYPTHSFNTRYWYNTLNQVVRDSTPDRGRSDYWYDKLGRLVVSRNAEQALQTLVKQYTYTRYDALGRVIETGLTFHISSDTIANGKIWDYTEYEDWLDDGQHYFNEVTKTYYDESVSFLTTILNPYFPNSDGSNGQTNLRNRVATILFEESNDDVDSTYSYATHYSYDIAGNVKQLVQDFPELDTVGHRYKRIGYDYDLISGKVNYVYYQRDSIDQFIHHYVYDADNRVEYVETSNNGYLWERDANYEYYLHGPLGRTELGERRVQGLDYAYTLQGWLKGMNASALRLDTAQVADFATRDMGRDGKSGNTGDLARNKTVARDVAAFTLGYYYGEYRQISTIASNRFEMQYSSGGHFESGAPSLYNGNIRHAVYSIAKLHEQGKYEASPEGYAYHYDQLNRLVQMEAYNSGYSHSSYNWTSGSASDILKERVEYDPNGNIMSYDRYGNAGSPATVMDSLTYHYTSEKNRLTYIDDDQTNQSAYDGDLEDQTDGGGNGNYGYNELGNLIRDNSESISNIIWTNSQKIRKIDKTSTEYWFYYNPMQQRVVKREKQNISGNPEVRTYYVRDAQGNVMATYKAWLHSSSSIWDSIRLAEHHIYGSARVGIALPDVKLYPEVPENPYISDSVLYTLQEGWKRYELTNHLGNVLAVITDRKRGLAASGTDIQWYEADVMATQQYYPFGMLMPTSTDSSLRRQYSLNAYDYRYGFNGKEGDDEIKGDDNQQDYGMRIYDPRVGRFLSVDPITREYPMLTPYQFASNRPIDGIDLDGLEYLSVNDPAFDNTNKPKPKSSGFFSFLSGCTRVKTYGEVLRQSYESQYSKIIIAGQQYYDIGHHLYRTETEFTNTGSRESQATEATKVGIQLLANYNRLSDATPSTPISWSDESIAGIEATHRDANLYKNCMGVCYAVSAARVNKAYSDIGELEPINLKVSGKNSDHKIMASTDGAGGFGVGGVLVKHGLGSEVGNIWDGTLQSGAQLQIWHPDNRGHSQIFHSYNFLNGNIISINVFDNYNGGSNMEMIGKETNDTIKAVNIYDKR
ncbi:MAG: RHS repeat-associated core domain-containing protein [Saprospiraceae bacterium]